MNVLITGATGFIGSNLCRKLYESGDSVKAFALPNEPVDHIQDYVSDVFRGDLTDPQTLKGVCDGLDAVYHLAARVTDWGPRKAFYDAIYDATENLLNEARGKAKRFVYVSSMAACGLGKHLKGRTEADPGEKSGVPYNDAKLDAEYMVGTKAANAIEYTIVRPANVIGPGSVWVKDVLERFKKMPVPLMDGGRHSASLIHVGNLADGIALAGSKPEANGRTYFLRDDWNVTWKQYMTDLSAMIGKKPGFSLPFSLVWYSGLVLESILTPLRMRPPVTRLAAGVMGRDNDVDCTRARWELGWLTTVSYPEAMEEIRAYVSEHMNR